MSKDWNHPSFVNISPTAVVTGIGEVFTSTTAWKPKKLIFFFLMLKGTGPFSGVIFYLWAEIDKINTACVKLRENHFLFFLFVTMLLWRHSFFTDPNENCTTYVCKIRNKRHFVHENFLIFGLFIEKITINYENHVNCPVTLHLSPPFPFGRPLGWVLLGTHLSHTWGYFFNTKKKKIVFT